MKLRYLMIAVVFILPILCAKAAGDVVITEVAWMGSQSSSSDEWIELFNTSQGTVSLEGWRLESADGGITVVLSGNIPAGGFFLLERTNDDSVPTVAADLIYSGALSNDSEVLILRNKEGAEIDRIDASSGWMAGDNANKDTMQRGASAWISAPATPKSSGKAPPPDQTAPPQEQPAQSTNAVVQETSVKAEPALTVIKEFPTSIIISEFLADPKGSDTDAEWIELFNKSQSPQLIEDFFIDDKEGGSHPYRIAKGTTIGPLAFLVFSRKDTKIALNNSDDEVRLLYPTKKLAARVAYAKAPERYVAVVDASKNVLTWSSIPTPGKPNHYSTATNAATLPSMPKEPYQNITSLAQLPELNPGDLIEGKKSSNEAPEIAAAPVAGSLKDFWSLLTALFIGAAGAFAYLRFVRRKNLFTLIALLVLGSVVPVAALAETFNVSPQLHKQAKEQIEADVVWAGTNSVFFVENGLLFSQSALQDLGKEFDQKIFPELTAVFGQPLTPGVDNDSRITVLFMSMVTGVGGYFNGEDMYTRGERSASNQREMVYLSADFIGRSRLKAFLAHEFQHVISFSQKGKRLNAEEETWTNEVRSEYAPTLLGYDNSFKGSNLEERFRHYLSQPHDHLTGWANSQYDYAVINMFGQYLGSRFGSRFFQEEARVNAVGKTSFEGALKLLDANLTFAKFFGQWKMANYINDKSVLQGKYAYANPNLSFFFPPEINIALENPDSPKRIVTSIIPSFSAKAAAISLEGNPAKVTFSTSEPAPELVVTYLKQLQNGLHEDGQLLLDGENKTLSFGKAVKTVTLLLSNASETIISPKITLTAESQTALDPVVSSLQPVFVTPTREHNTFLIKGEHFDPQTEIYFNEVKKDAVFQDATTLVVRVTESAPTIEIKAVNPAGGQATFSWENPLGALLAATTQLQEDLISNGSLIRAEDDYKVYIVKDGFKRHIVSASIFSFYPHLGFSVVKVIDSAKALGYKEASLIRAAGDDKIYEVLPDGKKRWIKTAEEFLARGFDWKAVFEVNAREVNFYPTAQ